MDESLLNAIRVWNPWYAKPWRFPAGLVSRTVLPQVKAVLGLHHVKDIIGVRRCGKTTLLLQVIKDLITDYIQPERIVFLNFNDLVINSVDFNTLLKALYVIAPDFEYLFLDEVQEKAGWERWVGTLHETGRVKQIFITGSTASLISEDVGKLLTGRHVSFVLYPFSFKEVLDIERWTEFDPAFLKKELFRLNGYLEKYLLQGGFPEAYNMDPLATRQVLTNLFNDIMARDIASRSSVDIGKLIALAQYIMSNFTREFSFRKVSTALGMHVDTVEKYLTFLQGCFMIFKVSLFSYKQLHQFHENKKFYAIDNGLRNQVSFQTTKDMGKMAENAVYLALKSQNKEIYYWKDGQHEVDFLVTKGAVVESIIQVCWDESNIKTREREIAGIVVAAKNFGCKEGIVLNRDLEGEETLDGITVRHVPIALWLLSN